MNATCATCPFWNRRADQGEDAADPRGYCHHALAMLRDGDVTIRASGWCSEHPLRQRDRLAAMAMNGLLAFVADSTLPGVPPSRLAANAYRIADAMLAASLSPPSEGSPSEGGKEGV